MKIEAFWDLNSISEIKNSSMAAKTFEEEFIHFFLKEVRKGLKDPLLGNSFASKIYYDMFDMQMAKAISDSGKIGIKEYIQNAVEKYKNNSNG
jgi:flagellar protein FlgJ